MIFHNLIINRIAIAKEIPQKSAIPLKLFGIKNNFTGNILEIIAAKCIQYNSMTDLRLNIEEMTFTY
jgi:hypothetical protein